MKCKSIADAWKKAIQAYEDSNNDKEPTECMEPCDKKYCFWVLVDLKDYEDVAFIYGELLGLKVPLENERPNES